MNLVKPKIAHYKAVMEADRDFERAGEEPYCGASGRVGYMGWLLLLDRQSKPECMDYGSNPNEIYFLMDDEEKKIYGFGQLRPYDTVDVLTWAGHIGYSVRPSRRRRGYATRMLAAALEVCRELGLSRVMIASDSENAASARTIERCGGVMENEVPEDGRLTRRYWIDL